MDRAALELGSDVVRTAIRRLPLLTSRRHIDLVRVCSAASSLRADGPAAGHA
ncbi:hypothetical protein [Streptomyces sp. RP5T]|uniref:hypothetical protein n=1 Tax=Streptomyces sp. RP5T TaxID=2490848 RepID=UPI001639735A|nr:hypothetical protein [Streptomyces sp. RP5T]